MEMCIASAPISLNMEDDKIKQNFPETMSREQGSTPRPPELNKNPSLRIREKKSNMFTEASGSAKSIPLATPSPPRRPELAHSEKRSTDRYWIRPVPGPSKGSPMEAYR